MHSCTSDVGKREMKHFSKPAGFLLIYKYVLLNAQKCVTFSFFLSKADQKKMKQEMTR
jgi:hypothetical protein